MKSTITKAVELRARGEETSEFVRKIISDGEVIRVGRSPQADWQVTGDPMISREQAELSWRSGRLTVKCLDTARNSIVFQDQILREISISVGDKFQIGRTLFEVHEAGSPSGVSADDPFAFEIDDDDTTLEAEEPEEPDEPSQEHSFSTTALRQIRFDNAEKQMEVLSDVPELISSSESDEDLAQLLVGLLLKSIPHAEAVAVVHHDVSKLPEDVASAETFPEPEMMRVDTRDGFLGRFRPSRRLITKTLRQQQSVLHMWVGDASKTGFTVSEGLGWAFAAPIRGESCHGWCLYVSGKFVTETSIVTEDQLRVDLRFTEFVAQFIGSIRQVRLLQEHKTQLSSFFSPKVIESLTGSQSQSALMPAERDITVLFCDVRGFSTKSVELQDDLDTLLASINAALGVMAGGILDYDGAIADFQGDAALGFWGWPVELKDGPIPACRAALDIQAEFRSAVGSANSLLQGFSVGLGIAHGRALAGQIGTAKQAKVGVFGLVVNQGSRLEGMTKQFGVPICIDETTADYVSHVLSPTEARLRRLARVYPKGMDTALTVYGLLPPEHQYSDVTDQMIVEHDKAVDAVIEGRWPEAAQLLGGLPEDDGPATFLRTYLSRHDLVPPDDWDGVIRLRSKR